jgi:hypothetical protein
LRSSRLVTVVASCGLCLVSLSLLGGCGDDSKTTGTQLQMSPEVKAELEDMRSVQKEERAARKKERGQRAPAPKGARSDR